MNTHSIAAWTIVSLFLIQGCASRSSAKPTLPLSLETATSRFATLDGARIHYKDVGKGKRALVFIHGWAGDLGIWREQAAAFTRTRMIFIDLPGHGASDKPHIAYTQPYYAQAVAAVLDNAQVKEAILIGHSMGTPVAREFYRQYPVRTIAIVSVDGALRNSMSKTAAEQIIAPLRSADFEAAALRSADAMMSAQTSTEIRELVKSKMKATPQHVMVSAMEGMFDPQIWKDDPIVVPLLVINQARAWGDDYKTYVRSIAPDVEYHPMTGVSHFLMLERPDEFNAILRRFLVSRHLIRDRSMPPPVEQLPESSNPQGMS